VAAAAEANVHFSFPFSFSYLNFWFSLWVFLLTWIRLVRFFVDCWTFEFQLEEKRTKRKTNKAPDCSNVVQSID
jgi:hypothetical protein